MAKQAKKVNMDSLIEMVDGGQEITLGKEKAYSKLILEAGDRDAFEFVRMGNVNEKGKDSVAAFFKNRDENSLYSNHSAIVKACKGDDGNPIEEGSFLVITYEGKKEYNDDGVNKTYHEYSSIKVITPADFE